MLATIQELVSHKWYANASLLTAIHDHEIAAQDKELRDLLHHIIVANRFWLMLSLHEPFAIEKESRILDALETIVALYKQTQLQESAWVFRLDESDLDKSLETPFIPGRAFSVVQALIQVCMHSHGHRAQCAARLRTLGGIPPATDYITWLKDRPAPHWPLPG